MKQFDGGSCRSTTATAGGQKSVKLADICVRSICKHFTAFGKLPTGLPPELVAHIMECLAENHVLAYNTLLAFKGCEMMGLHLEKCRGVEDSWLLLLAPELPPCCLTVLNLSGCVGVTDVGLNAFSDGALAAVETLSLRHCYNITGSSILRVLRQCPKLQELDLAYSPEINDELLRQALPGLSHLESVNLEGCEKLTDASLQVIANLPSLRFLVLRKCRGIGASNLMLLHLFEKLEGSIESLDVGWCGSVQQQQYEDGVTQFPRLNSLKHLCASVHVLENQCLRSLGSALPALTELSLRGCTLDRRALWVILRNFPLLAVLDVSSCHHVNELPPGNYPHLRSLILAKCPSLRDRAFSRICAHPDDMEGENVGNLTLLPNIMNLNLANCKVGDGILPAISRLKTLTAVSLADVRITNSGVSELSKLPAIRSLNLFSTCITNAGVVSLEKTVTLTSLNVDVREIGDPSLISLSRLPRLRNLDAFSAAITNVGMLGCLPKMVDLTSLDICGGLITDAGLKALKDLIALKRLNLSQNEGITSDGVAHLSGLYNLRSLNLSHTGVQTSAILHFSRMTRLEQLTLYDCKFGDESLADLMRLLPSLRAVRL
jgi:hypothetical protein